MSTVGSLGRATASERAVLPAVLGVTTSYSRPVTWLASNEQVGLGVDPGTHRALRAGRRCRRCRRSGARRFAVLEGRGGESSQPSRWYRPRIVVDAPAPDAHPQHRVPVVGSDVRRRRQRHRVSAARDLRRRHRRPPRARRAGSRGPRPGTTATVLAAVAVDIASTPSPRHRCPARPERRLARGSLSVWWPRLVVVVDSTSGTSPSRSPSFSAPARRSPAGGP